MADDSSKRAAADARLRRTLEIVYAVEGVTSARVWIEPGRVSIGVRVAASESPPALFARIEAAVSALREPGEAWELGLLDDA